MFRRSYHHWFSSLTALILVLVGVFAESLHRPHLPGVASSCGHASTAQAQSSHEEHDGHGHHHDGADADHQSSQSELEIALSGRHGGGTSHEDTDCVLCRFLARTIALLAQSSTLVVALPVERAAAVDDRPLPSRPRTAHYSRGPPSLS